MQKKHKIILAVIGVLIAVPLFAVIAFNNSTSLQDRLVSRALDATLARQFARSQTYGGDNLDVVFCGTASPMGASDRAQSCIAVMAGEHVFLVDTGARSAARAAASALPLGSLDGVFLTHFHSDHIAALGEMHLQSWAQGRDGKLKVYGGPGVEQVVAGFNMAYGQDYHYRTTHHTERLMPSANAGLVAYPFPVPDSGMVELIDKGDLKISAFKVPHEPVHPAVGYRFDYKGRSIVISGDTSKTSAMVDASRGADVLIHEVLQPYLVNITSNKLKAMGRENLGGIIFDTLDYHTSPVETAQLANEAEVPMLVFTHFAPAPANGVIEGFFMRGVDEIRPDGVLLADDGMHIRLPVGSDAINIMEE